MAIAAIDLPVLCGCVYFFERRFPVDPAPISPTAQLQSLPTSGQTPIVSKLLLRLIHKRVRLVLW